MSLPSVLPRSKTHVSWGATSGPVPPWNRWKNNESSPSVLLNSYPSTTPSRISTMESSPLFLIWSLRCLKVSVSCWLTCKKTVLLSSRSDISMLSLQKIPELISRVPTRPILFRVLENQNSWRKFSLCLRSDVHWWYDLNFIACVHSIRTNSC